MNIRAKIFGGVDASEGPLLKAKDPKGARTDELQSVTVARESRHRQDTRKADRHRLQGERARITHNGRDFEVKLINLSGGGAMIEAARFAPQLWDRVELHLGAHGDIECAVCWVCDRRIGLEFAHETRLDCAADEVATVLREIITRRFGDIEFPEAQQPAPQQEQDSAKPETSAAPRDEHRAAPRHPLIWTGTLYHDFQTTPVRIRNISETGAMVESSIAVRVGAQPLLEVGEAASLSATVLWAIGDQVGLRFNDPFDMRLLAQSQPTVAEASWTPPEYLKKAATDLRIQQNHWGRLTMTELKQELEGFIKH